MSLPAHWPHGPEWHDYRRAEAIIDSFSAEWDRKVAEGEMVDGLDILEAFPVGPEMPTGARIVCWEVYRPVFARSAGASID